MGVKTGVPYGSFESKCTPILWARVLPYPPPNLLSRSLSLITNKVVGYTLHTLHKSLGTVHRVWHTRGVRENLAIFDTFSTFSEFCAHFFSGGRFSDTFLVEITVGFPHPKAVKKRGVFGRFRENRILGVFYPNYRGIPAPQTARKRVVLGRFSGNFVLFGGFLVIFWSFFDHFLIIFWLFFDHFLSIFMTLFLGHLSQFPGVFWFYNKPFFEVFFESFLKRFLGHFGVFLGCFWPFFDPFLGCFWGCFLGCAKVHFLERNESEAAAHPANPKVDAKTAFFGHFFGGFLEVGYFLVIFWPFFDHFLIIFGVFFDHFLGCFLGVFGVFYRSIFMMSPDLAGFLIL